MIPVAAVKDRGRKAVRHAVRFGYTKLTRGNVPAFLIVGAQKAGTTSLHAYLDRHPRLQGSRPKELNYFSTDLARGVRFDDYLRRFPGPRDRLHFESTPSYMSIPGVAAELGRLLPDAKLIVVLRQPTDRAYSAWNFYRHLFDRGDRYRLGRDIPGANLYRSFFEGRDEFPSFRECIEIELDCIARDGGFEPAILRRGLYLEQLDRLWSHYPSERVLILGFRDVVERTAGTLERIYSFLEVAPVPWSSLDARPRNVRGYAASLAPADRNFVDEFFQRPNADLAARIGEVAW